MPTPIERPGPPHPDRQSDPTSPRKRGEANQTRTGPGSNPGKHASAQNARPLAQRLLWFAALWLGGVGAVALVSFGLRLWLAPK
jgi:hypothetical protein